MAILMSIKPEYANKIFSGIKRYEFRKRIPKQPYERVYVYSSSPVKKIIIQAGGKGTRLEGLTRNKPKCMVPVNNLPIIFYAFQKFKDAEFTIIADYKTNVLEKYLNAFASQYNFKIIKATKKVLFQESKRLSQIIKMMNLL